MTPNYQYPILYLTENNDLTREMQEYGILTFSFLQLVIQLVSAPIQLSKEQQETNCSQGTKALVTASFRTMQTGFW